MKDTDYKALLSDIMITNGYKRLTLLLHILEVLASNLCPETDYLG
jgi:hypothetical protein